MKKYLFITAFLSATSLTTGSEPQGPVQVMEPVATFMGEVGAFTPPVPRERPRADFDVVDSKQIVHAHSTVTYKRVKPPENLPRVERQTVAAPSAAEQQASFDYWMSKPHRVSGLSVVIFDRDYSEVRWRHDGREYRIYSDIDFTLFRSMSRIETADAIYSFTMAIEEVSTDQVRAQHEMLRAEGLPTTLAPAIPERPEFVSENAEYIVLEGRPAFPGESDPFALIDWLHVYFEDHEPELRERRFRLEEYNQALKQWRAENPPPDHREITLTFWPGKNSAHLDENAE